MQHYNRDPKQKPEDADKEYETFVKNADSAIEEAMDHLPYNSDEDTAKYCRLVLEIKGKQDHAFQDFYAHAITRDGSFEAFSKEVKGNPLDRKNFWPSSYSLVTKQEHPQIAEPVKEGTEEYKARFSAALEFMQRDYSSFLPKWWSKCSCVLHKNMLKAR